MTLFMRSLFLGYSVAISAAVWLSASGVALWATILVAWIGGNVLGLGFAVIGSWIQPELEEGANGSDFQLWDDDLAREMIDADLRLDVAPAAGASARLREAG